MAESVLMIILQIIQMLIYNSLTTLGQLLTLVEQLLAQLGFVSQAGGPLGLAVALAVLAVVAVFLGRYVIGLGKSIIILFIAGVAIAAVIIASLL